MTTAASVPSAEEVAAYCGAGVTAESVASTLAAEQADQASRCRVEPYTAALAAALMRRVKRAREMDKFVLGVRVEADQSYRLGSRDPEIRRLEAPYRRLVLG